MTETETATHELPYYPAAVIAASAALFALLAYIAVQFTPAKAKSTWKFKNISVSLIHAVITGPWSFYCLVFTPGLAQDVINVYDASSYTLICFCLGYIVYDCIDMVLHHMKRDSLELLGHHAVILVCFGITVVLKTYVGYAVVALVVEVNSVFLHVRQLMLICRVDKSSEIYRLNSLANVGSYITFRIMTFGWMTRWLFLNKDLVPLTMFSIGSLGLAVITVMNIVLFYRLLKSDFLPATLTSENKAG